MPTFLNLIDVEGDLETYNWDALHKLIIVLQPPKDIIHELQKKFANVKTFVDAIVYLRMVASREATLQQPIEDNLRKWIDGNSVVEGLIHSRGNVYDFIVSRCSAMNMLLSLIMHTIHSGSCLSVNLLGEAVPKTVL